MGVAVQITFIICGTIIVLAIINEIGKAGRKK